MATLTLDNLAEYLLTLYEHPDTHPEAIITDIWRRDRYALESILRTWHPRKTDLRNGQRGAVPWFVGQYTTAVNDEQYTAYAHDLFIGFVTTVTLDYVQEAVRILAGETLRQRSAA
jgi:hypothetical protein